MKRSIALFFFLMVLAAPGLAHTLSVTRIHIESQPDASGARVEVDIALRDLALAMPIDANADDAITWGELVAMRPRVESMVQDKIRLSGSDGACALQPDSLGTRRYAGLVYASLSFRTRCASASGVALDYSLFFDQDAGHRAVVTYRRNGVERSAVARSGASVADFRQPASVDRMRTFREFLREGIHHILIGYDHIAFLVSLLLPAALVRKSGAWTPVPRFRESLLHVLGIVTAFTLAHSVTLSLAALGWVTPAARWVEALIAASVLLAALNNLKPVVTRRVWLVGFGFGLIHGFGFAGALGELGLPKNDTLTALVSFNLGVEVGQIAIVCVLLPVLYAVRRQRWYARYAMPALSVAIIALAATWLMERLTG